mmetsp:Transcript_12916/g.32574  ORF Transcript_12916/g.32574 Transcript_12916/m.32574 type:complete len:149 (-) Transcript_12916:269-715(-)|eukprot:CAMPEP_0116098890 /NCGR_PEP_ID=MMETSP0327-20121206/11476_1 /TAXON_ID=44447 /ORGANISM="Pseudo-nitzschia delicatissima, Strain B596" /LENGTH=148 /DNA_ID=CAMNT_0003590731 /DNA_START=126 /DNA_END=572 /DNA_ORIENTATION=-
MKRSSSVAALDDSIDVKFGDYYEDSVLVTSMRLVTIDEDRRGGNQLLRKQRSDGSMSSMSATSGFSRSSSRSSLRGWGSSASRKSYKVDLCSLASTDDFLGETTSNDHRHAKVRRNNSATLALEKSSSSDNGASLTNQALDSWGFFLE